MMVCSFGNLFHLASTCSVIPFQCPSYLRIQVKPGNPSRLFICFMVGITHPFTSIIGKRENKTKHTHTQTLIDTLRHLLCVCVCVILRVFCPRFQSLSSANLHVLRRSAGEQTPPAPPALSKVGIGGNDGVVVMLPSISFSLRDLRSGNNDYIYIIKPSGCDTMS